MLEIQEALTKIITPSQPDRFPLLSMPSQPCSIPPDTTDNKFIDNLLEIVESLGNNAVGLAAIQIGYPKQIFVAKIKGKYKTFINAKILWKSNEKTRREEGCLSIPELSLFVPRSRKLKLQYFTEFNELVEEEFSGLEARIIQHEMDHCNGKTLQNHMQILVDKHVKKIEANKKRKEKRKAKNRAKRKR